MHSANDIVLREARRADMPGISRVRTSVVENLLTREQLDARGITEASVAASSSANSKGWVALSGDEIVAFSIADRASRSVFALFVLPQYERTRPRHQFSGWRSSGCGPTARTSSG